MLLDVNMGAPLADEAALMTEAVALIQELTDLPLVIDSSIIEVLDAGLSAYQGKALVNSVTAEDERMDAILPLVKKYGAAVIGLPNDEEEIPEEPARRVELARKLIAVATETYKIPIEDIVIDPLAMPVGADTLHPGRTIKTRWLASGILPTTVTSVSWVRGHERGDDREHRLCLGLFPSKARTISGNRRRRRARRW
jgi:5-methyltetrahydrofolate--homocysteine methyltransferase